MATAEPLDVNVRAKRSEVKALLAAWDERDAVADFPTAEPLIERLHAAVDPDARHEYEGGSDAHVMRGDAHRPPASGEGRTSRELDDETIVRAWQAAEDAHVAKPARWRPAPHTLRAFLAALPSAPEAEGERERGDLALTDADGDALKFTACDDGRLIAKVVHDGRPEPTVVILSLPDQQRLARYLATAPAPEALDRWSARGAVAGAGLGVGRLHLVRDQRQTPPGDLHGPGRRAGDVRRLLRPRRPPL